MKFSLSKPLVFKEIVELDIDRVANSKKRIQRLFQLLFYTAMALAMMFIVLTPYLPVQMHVMLYVIFFLAFFSGQLRSLDVHYNDLQDEE